MGANEEAFDRGRVEGYAEGHAEGYKEGREEAIREIKFMIMDFLNTIGKMS